jgi:L-alanine-DL-glutamate epimerase-like enolase superfamily enzyme
MKITQVRTLLLTGPATNDPFTSECRHRRSAAFIEVDTNVGVRGLGETYAGYFFPEIVPATVKFFEPILIGQNVDDIAGLWSRMYQCGNFWCRVGWGAAVLSGIEAALWDLKGKLEKVPVHRLLGNGGRDTLPCYASGGPSNYPKDRLAQKIDFYISLGFKAVKLGTGSFNPKELWTTTSTPDAAAEFEVDKLQFVRSRFGPKFEIMLDGHMGNSPGATWTLPTAKAVVRAVEPYNLSFFEEPLHYTDYAGYAELCRSSKIPIAGGECLTASCEWKIFADNDAFDIAQPDASFMGISEFMQTAAMFHRRGRQIATHSWGAGASLMQNIHCAFACSNTRIIEIPPDYGPLHTEIAGDSLQIRNGAVHRPEAPGFGIHLSDETKAAFPFVPGSGEFNSVPGKVMPEDMRDESD